MNDDIDKIIAEVERLDREATPGPWTVEMDSDGDEFHTWEWPWRIKGVVNFAEEGENEADPPFIALSRTAAPLLAAEVKRLRAEVLSWTRTAAMHEHMYLEIAAENEDLRLTLAAEQGRQEGAPIESNEAADEYDYTRCICLDSVSRWCPTCGEEYAERRVAMLAADAATG